MKINPNPRKKIEFASFRDLKQLLVLSSIFWIFMVAVFVWSYIYREV